MCHTSFSWAFWQIFNLSSWPSSKFCLNCILERSRVLFLGTGKLRQSNVPWWQEEQSKKKWFRLSWEEERARDQLTWPTEWGPSTSEKRGIVTSKGFWESSREPSSLVQECRESRRKVSGKNRWNNWQHEKKLRIGLWQVPQKKEGKEKERKKGNLTL